MSPAVLIQNSSQLLTFAGEDHPRRGKEMSSLGLVRQGAVLIQDGKILAAGVKELVLSRPEAKGAEVIDAKGKVVLPGFVDSHSHPVFAGPRLADFEGRLQGLGYAELAGRGGGILSTVHGVRQATEAQLAAGLRLSARRFLEAGTTTLEAKSGYGLDLESELKILRVIRTVGAEGPLELVPTFIGAHAVPAELKDRPEEYLRRVCEDMIPAAAREKLASFVDVFCDQGYFSLEDARRVFEASSRAGLGLKIHAEQLSRSGASRLAAEAGAASADHLDFAGPEDIGALAAGGTVACLVPGSNYFLGKPYPPARALIDAGAAVALATDFNPGTCPCWDMRMILSIATTQMRLSPAEALCAATVNGAWALGLGKTHGTLEAGRRGDLVIYDAEDYREIPYYFGSGGALLTLKGGQVVHRAAGFLP